MSTSSYPSFPTASYMVRIQGPQDVVEAWLPDTFGFSEETSWRPFMENGQIVRGKIGELGNDAAQVLFSGGQTLMTQSMSAQLFQGAGYVSFALPLEFVANYSASQEVTEPIKKLLGMAAPTLSGGFLKAPSTYTSSLEPDQFVTLTIGTFFRAKDLICKSVTPVWDGMMAKGGTPFKARCDVVLETMKIPTAENIKAWFLQ
jgi:hypothetical protein